MLKPSQEIAEIYNQIQTGKKTADNLPLTEIGVIMQAIIYWLDFNATMADEKRKAELDGE
jgi:hypothetical protein